MTRAELLRRVMEHPLISEANVEVGPGRVDIYVLVRECYPLTEQSPMAVIADLERSLRDHYVCGIVYTVSLLAY